MKTQTTTTETPLPSIPWLATRADEERETVAARRRVRAKSTVYDWTRATIDFNEETGEWYARPHVTRSHEGIRRAKRQEYHLRADGWIDPRERMAVAEKVIAYQIRRIAARNNLRISETDEADARGAAFAALVARGFFEHSRISLTTFRALRNAIQGPECLRLRRRWEKSTGNPETVAVETGITPEFTVTFNFSGRAYVATDHADVSHRFTVAQRDRIREIMRTLRASRDADPSRKASAAFKSQRNFFLLTLSAMTGRSSRSLSPGTFDTRKSRFLDYLAKGAELTKPDLGREIMASLANRFTTQSAVSDLA